jgi:hypothetical protein
VKPARARMSTCLMARPRRRGLSAPSRNATLAPDPGSEDIEEPCPAR